MTVTFWGLGAGMMYYAYQAQADLMKPWRAAADAAVSFLNGPLVNQFDSAAVRHWSAALSDCSRPIARC